MGGETRNVTRCGNCQFNQFETQSGSCRRCGASLASKPLEQIVAKIVAEPDPEPMTLAQVIGKKITKARINCHLKQSELAQLARLGRNTMNRAEGGVIAPTVKTLTRIALVLGVEIGSLLPTREEQARMAAVTGEKDLLEELTGKVHEMQESDRNLLLHAAKSMSRGQTFLLDTIAI